MMPSQVVQPGDGCGLSDRRVGPVVVVMVDPCWQSRESGGFGAVELLEGPALGQGPVEAFDLAVGLWPVGAGLLGRDVEIAAVSRERFDLSQLPLSLSTR